MKVSVVIATYNGGKYLVGQLESIAGQTRPPDEIVITDDGSTDDTMAMAYIFAESAPFPVNISFNPENLGYARNFAHGLSLSTGEFVFFSDQDDCWLPTKVEAVLTVAERNPSTQVFMNDAFLTDENLGQTGQTILSRIRGAGMGDSRFLHGSCMGVRRHFLDIAFPLPPGVEAHDTWLVGLAEDYGARMIIEEPLQLYRRHEEATSTASVTAGTDRVTKFSYYRDLVLERLRGDTTAFLESSLADTTRRLGRVRDWLEAASSDDALYQASIDVAQALETRREAVRARMSLLGAPAYRRLPGVARLAARHQYAAFNGARTAVRDALFLDRLFARLGRKTGAERSTRR